MLRKMIIASAAGMLLVAGMATAQSSMPYPASPNETGAGPGEAPTTSYDGAAAPAWLRGRAAADFPSSANEGPVFGDAPTTLYDRAPVGATGADGAGGEVGPVMTPGIGNGQVFLDD